LIGECLPSSPRINLDPCGVGLCLRPNLGEQAARAFSLGTNPGLSLLQPVLSTPQNLAIKTPSPRPQLHRKRNTFGLGPARRVRFRWISKSRQRLPCALEEPFPTVMRRTLTAKRTAAVEKMARGPARDSVGPCLCRKHYAFLTS